ncbi:MAG: NAD(P)/FAD-dependent oxidoreductase [Planctomycetes bacterium]|nr:NAD(P)/FAD-dependent oxidoreductase [Planctomycetota bacterium]
MSFDAIVIGAGAAGLMTAIIAGRERPGIRLALLESQPRCGTKILVSGGGRCNVTNRVVRPTDFNGDRNFVAKALGRFGAERAAAFFEEIGVPLKHEAEFDKLFPVSDDAHTVRDALVGESERVGCGPRTSYRVRSVVREADGGFVVTTSLGVLRAPRVVLATGGRSIPLSGSDGFGWEIAKSLGHSVTPTVPALVPLVLDPHPLAGLDGIAFPCEIRVTDPAAGGRLVARVTGPVLVTHFGISGPAALDVSRHWAVAAEAGRQLEFRLSFAPGKEQQAVEAQWLAESLTGGSRPVVSLLAGFPRRIIERLLSASGVKADQRLGELSREARIRLLLAFTSTLLPVKESRGFNFAEVTAGGVPVSEVDARTMESKLCPGLHFVGEILDVEGRLGGFNFQWAWSTGFVCGQAVAVGAKNRR